MTQKQKKCFVIMPFGKKSFDTRRTPDPALAGNEKTTIDFDDVFKNIIKVAAVSTGLDCTRSDSLPRSGLIQKSMIEDIYESDLVIVDITTVNANVFYELGIRHALRRSGTLLVRQAGQTIPFNISGMKVVNYDQNNPEDSILIMSEYIKSSLHEHAADSLVHILVPDLNISRARRRILETEVHDFSIPENPLNTIGFITGDMMDVDMVDVWLNPENTKMQMSRYHEGSVSANIRYYGSKRNKSGHVKTDLIANALADAMGGIYNVEPGTVFITTAGELRRRNNVQAIVHMASMYGEPGKGYHPIKDHEACISKAFQKIDQFTSKKMFWSRTPRLKSILVPLFGTRSAHLAKDAEGVANSFFKQALNYFLRYPDTSIEKIYFLAFTEEDRELCEAAAAGLGLRAMQSKSDEPNA